MPYSKSTGRGDGEGAEMTGEAGWAGPPDDGTAATRVPEPTTDST